MLESKEYQNFGSLNIFYNLQVITQEPNTMF